MDVKIVYVLSYAEPHTGNTMRRIEVVLRAGTTHARIEPERPPQVMPHVYSSIIDAESGNTRAQDVAALLEIVKQQLS